MLKKYKRINKSSITGMENLIFILIMLIIMLSSCRNKGRQIDRDTYQEYISRGNQISGLAQGVLLANVGSAIQRG